MPRPTVRGYSLLGLAAATYLAGRLLGTWELYYFGFAFLAAVVLSWLMIAITGGRIRVARNLDPERPVAGDEPELASLIDNASLLPGPQLTLQNTLGNLAPKDIELEVNTLAPRSQKALKTRTGPVNRGVHLLPPARAAVEDPLGLARAAHAVSDPLTVTVLPRIAFLDSCALYPDMGLKHDWAGRHGLLTPGASEFRGVRPHQPGEPLSHIDWKSTAKTGTLMLRELEEPAGADITLLLDGSAGQVVGNAPDSNFELAVRAAGSIADFVLRAGRGVSLLCHERSWRQQRLTADGGGRRALLQMLAETRPDATAPLASALRHLRTGGPHLLRAQTVTLVSISLDHQLVRTLIQLREDGARLACLYVVAASFLESDHAVSALLPFLPPREFERSTQDNGKTGRDSPTSSALRPQEPALPAEAKAMLLSLSSAGIPCLTLRRGEDLMRNLSLWRPGHLGRVASQ